MSELLRQYETWECLGDGYPEAWHRARRGELAIKDLIRELAGHRCQRCGHPYAKGEHPLEEVAPGEFESWSPCDEQCRHGGPTRGVPMEKYGYPPDPTSEVQEALWRILTVHHLDEDKRNCRWWNLAALCQRCHLRMQRAVVMDRTYHYEHSEWFKPHAAGFYAWKYLGEELDREQTMARLEELLALEHRFTQEAIF